MNWTRPRMFELLELDLPRKPAAVDAIVLIASQAITRQRLLWCKNSTLRAGNSSRAGL